MKKLWLWGVVGLVLGLGLLAQPSQAAYAPVEGDIIKTANHSATYYIGADHNRHLYVNAVTFWTWYSGDWSNIKENGVTKTIKVIGQDDFDNLTLGDNATAKPGMKLIKFSNSPRIYTVVSKAKIALVPDDATAQLLFGDDWSQEIITIQNGFEINYAKDGVLDTTNKITAIKQLFATKYDKDVSDITVTISKEIDTHVQGSVQLDDGGGYFFAAKANGEWFLVFDGNGAIECILLQNNGFPEDIINSSDCY